MSKQKQKLNPATNLVAWFVHIIDLIVASVIIVAGAFMYYEATLFPPAPNILGDTLNADIFPKMLIVLMIILASIIPFEIKFMPEKIAIFSGINFISKGIMLAKIIIRTINILGNISAFNVSPKIFGAGGKRVAS